MSTPSLGQLTKAASGEGQVKGSPPSRPGVQGWGQWTLHACLLQVLSSSCLRGCKMGVGWITPLNFGF